MKDRSGRTIGLPALLLAFVGVVAALPGLRAAPQDGEVSSLIGSAIALQATSAESNLVQPTAQVVLPAGGGGPISSSAIAQGIPGVFSLRGLNADTQGTHLP